VVAALPPPPAAPAPSFPSLRPPVERSATAALLLPLSGPSAPLGAALLNAAQLALFELADNTFTLLPFDTKGTPEGAAAAAQAALAQQADILLGPLFSGEAKAVGAVAVAANRPVLSFTADRSAAGNGVYALGFLPGPQAVQVVQYAQSHNRPRLAVLAPGNEYGRRVVEWLYNDSTVSSAIGPVEYYDINASDLLGPIKRLLKPAAAGPGGVVDPGFDALLLPDEGVRLRGIAGQLAAQGIDPAKVKLLGTQLWEDAKPGSEAALAGGWYAAPAPAGRTDFETRYSRAFGAKPPRLASLAYDATALAAVLARRSPHDYGEPVLTSPTGFAGVDGLFRLRPDGTSERGYAIWEVVANGQPVPVAPAPASFQAAY
jgi:ABC-type branched-subunit amino acid transport system substrate-binding protein